MSDGYAAEFANVTREEVLSLLSEKGPSAAPACRRLSDVQLELKTTRRVYPKRDWLIVVGVVVGTGSFVSDHSA